MIHESVLKQVVHTDILKYAVQVFVITLYVARGEFLIVIKVLDEADRLLEDDFGDQLSTIFAAVPKKRQTLLFSATFTDTLKELTEVAMHKPFIWLSKSV